MEEQTNVVENKSTNNISRQQRRQQERDERKYNETMRKQLSAYATKGDLMMLVDAFQKLRDRLFQLDIINSALEKVIVNKGLCTREEIKELVEYEAKRAIKLKEVNDEKGNYEKRLDICKEWDIVPDMTKIPEQILNDIELTKEQKLDFAEKYNLDSLLEKVKSNV